MTRFKYPPLQDTSSTRLLRVLPSKDKNAQIACHLFNYSLSPAPEITHAYEALSYVWGSPVGDQPISINSRIIRITANLHDALLRIRNHELDRVLWIDAICIDQENQKEKEQQIQIMHKIYTQASRVLVWLGEMTECTPRAFAYIHTAMSAEADGCNPEPTDSQESEALYELFQRPWFTRVWVLQEVGLARSVQILCGSLQMDGYAFATGLQRHADRAPPGVRSALYLIRKAIFRPRDEIHLPQQHTLRELVDLYHCHEATVPHDKVYALLGMSTDDLTESGLLPDYSLPWEELFQRLLRYILSDEISIRSCPEKNLAVLVAHAQFLGIINNVEHIALTQSTFDVIPLGGGLARAHWTIRGPTNPIKNQDFLCRFKGASRLSIVRLCGYYFELIAIEVIRHRYTQSKRHKADHSVTKISKLHLVWGGDVAGYPTGYDRMQATLQSQAEIIRVIWDTNVTLHQIECSGVWIYHHIHKVLDLVCVSKKKLGARHQVTLNLAYSFYLFLLSQLYGTESKYASLFTEMGIIDDRHMPGACWDEQYLDDPDFVCGRWNVRSLDVSKISLDDLISQIRHSLPHHNSIEREESEF